MAKVKLGRTGIVTEQNAFGALPIQRISFEAAGKLLNRALDGGMTFIDTARAYTDSEEKIGQSIAHRRNEYYLASKTMAKTPEGFWKDLETSLRNLKTDYLDIYQFHCVDQCYRPGDGTGMYECMEEANCGERIVRHAAVPLLLSGDGARYCTGEPLQGKGHWLYCHEGAVRRPFDQQRGGVRVHCAV